MKSIKARLGHTWFGWQPRETEHYLRRLLEIQENEASELELAIKKERSAAKQLRKEAEEKAILLQAALEQAGEPLQELLESRMERSLEALRKQGEAEAESLRSMAEARRAQHERRLRELDKQLGEYKEALDHIMLETTQWIEKMQSLPVELQPILSDREIDEALRAAVQTYEVKADSTKEQSDDAERKENEAFDKLQSAKVIQFRMRSLLSKMERKVMGDESVQVTSDGMHLPTTGEHGSFFGSMDGRSAEAAAIESASAPVIAEARAMAYVPLVIQPKLSMLSSGFWGDLEPYLRVVDLPASKEVFVRTEDRSLQQNDAVPDRQQMMEPERKRDQKQKLAVSEGPAATETAAASAPEQTSTGSPALVQEIKAIQYRYIVGKEAGENLYGENGLLIAAKGKVITMDMVEAAEKAGKLSDLIVSMVIPGFGADE